MLTLIVFSKWESNLVIAATFYRHISVATVEEHYMHCHIFVG